jgi:hypothetical protein
LLLRGRQILIAALCTHELGVGYLKLSEAVSGDVGGLEI